ncbi:NTP transferase domain-containing protein [Candidatus Woesearchaeota archaeon]|nr:NTP transferase domain-containing protein [Candidatus Woesearchaeota archaeon]
MREKISITIDERLLSGIDGMVDNVYIKNRSQAIEHLVRSSLREKRTAVILAGGDEARLDIGNRVYSPLAPVRGRPLIEHAIRALRDSGFKAIYIISRHKVMTRLFETIKNGSDLGVSISYIEEKASSGTFQSLSLAKGKIHTPFLVAYADILFDKVNIEELWNDHVKNHALATIMLTTSPTPREKGTVKVEGTKVLEFSQKPKKSDIYLVFSPLFIAEPEIFDYEGKSLESDIFPRLAERGLLHGHLSSEKERHIHSIKDIQEVRNGA